MCCPVARPAAALTAFFIAHTSPSRSLLSSSPILSRAILSCSPFPPCGPTSPRRRAGAAARALAAAHPGTPVKVGTPSLPQGTVVAETAGWYLGGHPSTIQLFPSLGIQATPCTHRRLPSVAPCLLAPLFLAPCRMLLVFLPSFVPAPAALRDLLLSLAHLVHCACACCFTPCALYPSLLPARFVSFHSHVLRQVLAHCCIAAPPTLSLPSLLSATGLAAGPPSVPSCSPWRSDHPLHVSISSYQIVLDPGSGVWWRRRSCSMCGSASYRAVCLRCAPVSSSARTAALTWGVTPAAAA